MSKIGGLGGKINYPVSIPHPSTIKNHNGEGGMMAIISMFSKGH
jgi:hypothetical protein